MTFTFSVRNFSEQAPLPISFELADLNPQGWLAAPHTTRYSLVGLATLPGALTLVPGEMKLVPATVHSDGRRYGVSSISFIIRSISAPPVCTNRQTRAAASARKNILRIDV